MIRKTQLAICGASDGRIHFLVGSNSNSRSTCWIAIMYFWFWDKLSTWSGFRLILLDFASKGWDSEQFHFFDTLGLFNRHFKTWLACCLTWSLRTRQERLFMPKLPPKMKQHLLLKTPKVRAHIAARLQWINNIWFIMLSESNMDIADTTSICFRWWCFYGLEGGSYGFKCHGFFGGSAAGNHNDSTIQSTSMCNNVHYWIVLNLQTYQTYPLQQLDHSHLVFSRWMLGQASTTTSGPGKA